MTAAIFGAVPNPRGEETPNLITGDVVRAAGFNLGPRRDASHRPSSCDARLGRNREPNNSILRRGSGDVKETIHTSFSRQLPPAKVTRAREDLNYSCELHRAYFVRRKIRDFAFPRSLVACEAF